MIQVEGFVETGTAARVARELEALGGRPATVLINSPGGLAAEGAAVYSTLRKYSGLVTVEIIGQAASAASLIAMAGREILIDPAAVFMLHCPATLTFGDATEHQRALNMLSTLDRTYAKVYAEASGNRIEDVLDWMAVETWLDAEETVILGFADAVITYDSAEEAA